MNYDSAPTNVRSLEQRLRNLEGDDGLALRRRTAMALVVVSQMLPEGAVKGGSSMALRYGLLTRFTRDLDPHESSLWIDSAVTSRSPWSQAGQAFPGGWLRKLRLAHWLCPLRTSCNLSKLSLTIEASRGAR